MWRNWWRRAGGVGKSLVTALLASSLQEKGVQTAILDADITGPSIPRLFGIKGKADSVEEGIHPAVSEGGIQIMSTNLLLDHETDPVIWRGPMIAGMVKKFWTDVLWNQVDYMFVDMPPGTGDVPLTVFQSIKVDGIIVVTTPQELVGMIVEKAMKMAAMMKVPILGIVENMSYFECPSCHEKHYIFGKSHVEELADHYGIEAISKIPIDENIVKYGDQGKVEKIKKEWLNEIVNKIIC